MDAQTNLRIRVQVDVAHVGGIQPPELCIITDYGVCGMVRGHRILPQYGVLTLQRVALSPLVDEPMRL